MTSPIPKVSIGVPVYNGGATLRPMLDSLLQQTFADFEIIISDNASTDGTAAICESFAAQDARIRYIRQPTNIGPELNFKFVLDEARAPYFMWWACDDTRTPDFLEENVSFLETHPGYVASTSPNCFEGRDPASSNLVTFSIEGDVAERFNVFLDNGWKSHGIFYAVIRTAELKKCDIIGQKFLGFDWAVDLYLASRGQIHRTQKGLMVFGASGVSNQANAWKRYRTHAIGWILPFHRVSLYALKLSSGFSWRQRFSLVKRLLKLNVLTARAQFLAEFNAFTAKYLRPRSVAVGGHR